MQAADMLREFYVTTNSLYDPAKPLVTKQGTAADMERANLVRLMNEEYERAGPFYRGTKAGDSEFVLRMVSTAQARRDHRMSGRQGTRRGFW